MEAALANRIDMVKEEDVKVIECCVSLFLKTRNAKARDMMSKSIRYILNQYGITRLELPEYIVRATGAKYSVVEAKEVTTGRRCPNCDSPIYTDDSQVAILSIREGTGVDMVSFGCKCGRVFKRMENNED